MTGEAFVHDNVVWHDGVSPGADFQVWGDTSLPKVFDLFDESLGIDDNTVADNGDGA